MQKEYKHRKRERNKEKYGKQKNTNNQKPLENQRENCGTQAYESFSQNLTKSLANGKRRTDRADNYSNKKTFK